MSVLVKDMKKPKLCYEIIDGEPKRCPFVDADDDCVILRKKGIWTGQTWAEQYSKCPLVEVPESHGRLIDADEIIKEMDKMNVGGVVFETAVDYVKLIVNDATTIIEAENE